MVTILHLSAQGMWSLQSVSDLVKVLSDLSARSSCPLLCSSSCLPWFLSGVSLGILVALLGAIYFWFYLGHPAPLASSISLRTQAQASPDLDLLRPSALEKRARLASYRGGE